MTRHEVSASGQDSEPSAYHLAIDDGSAAAAWLSVSTLDNRCRVSLRDVAGTLDWLPGQLSSEIIGSSVVIRQRSPRSLELGLRMDSRARVPLVRPLQFALRVGAGDRVVITALRTEIVLRSESDAVAALAGEHQ